MNRISKVISRLVTPIYQEFPFIITFCILMGAFGIVSRILLFVKAENTEGMILPTVYLSYLFIWFFFSYILAFGITLIKKKVFKIIILILCFLFFIIQDFLVQHFNTNICPQYLTLVAETNQNEVRDFFHLFLLSRKTLIVLKRVSIVLFLYLFLELINKKFLENKHIERKEKFSLVLLLFLIPTILYGGFCSTRVYSTISNNLTDDASLDDAVPTDPFSRLYYSVCLLNKYGSQTKKAIDSSLNADYATIPVEHESCLNIVVVIGESFNKHHSNLYGYELNTTPYMCQEKKDGNLFVFNDVTTPANLTSIVIKNFLSTNALGYDEQWYDFPIFPSIFKQNGYNVFFWDNQKNFGGTKTFSYSLNSFLYNSSIQEISYSFTNDSTFSYDGDLVDNFLSFFKENSTGHCNIVLLHLMGQHMMFRERFPQEETWFSIDSVHREDAYLTEEKKQIIADYDNATKYNDVVLNKLFRFFQATNTVLVYFSDHGEEIYDYRDHIYRDQGNLTPEKLKYQYEVPFMIWCSDFFLENNNDIVSSISEAVDKPYSLDILSNLLFRIGGIQTPYYRQELDVLDSDYHCPMRVVDDNQSYDSIMSAASNKP